MKDNKNLPLHKTVHWRKFKEMAKQILTSENVDITKLNLDTIRCYRTFGREMQGRNVTFLDGCKHTPWVTDNQYEIYEIPSTENTSKIKSEGSFIVIAHNTSFNYWIAGRLTVTINALETVKRKKLFEICTFRPFGLYEIGGSDDGKIIVCKKQTREQIDCGFSLPHQFKSSFDTLGARKQAYGLNEPSIVFKLSDSQENKQYFVDVVPVVKYKKNNRSHSPKK